MKYLVITLIVLSFMGLLCSVGRASAQQEATATVTVTPMATRTATAIPFTSQSVTLASGNHLAIEYRATMGEVLLIVVLLVIFAATMVIFLYQFAYQLTAEQEEK